MIPKVVAYITRQRHECTEVLVFQHAHRPDAGVQVPGGTVHPGEDLVSALWREIEEETGLTDLRLVGHLATASFHADWRGEWQERNVFHVAAVSEVRDTWTHFVRSDGEDKGLEFVFSWRPIDEAGPELRWGQGDWLHLLTGAQSEGQQEDCR
jgi:ADP-ribose pyrophosphatase YjhB (NUDIX family)